MLEARKQNLLKTFGLADKIVRAYPHEADILAIVSDYLTRKYDYEISLTSKHIDTNGGDYSRPWLNLPADLNEQVEQDFAFDAAGPYLDTLLSATLGIFVTLEYYHNDGETLDAIFTAKEYARFCREYPEVITSKEKTPMTRIVVVVEGGLIQNIMADNPNAEVVVIDYDIDGSTDERITPIYDTEAFVTKWENPGDIERNPAHVEYVFKVADGENPPPPDQGE
jgi:hypothetical protein